MSISTAAQLLDFGARIGNGQRADEQLAGAVAIHNFLAQRGVAYLADEVGMGKTYVALGTLALLRHFEPNLRVLVIAPRENIQHKWMKEWRNFVAHNVQFPDLRVKALDGQPVRSLVACGNLLEFVHEATLNPNRDFFLRMSSFSLPVTGRNAVDPDAARRLRDGLRQALPWLRDDVFDLRNKQTFKDNVARAVCCALPRFDLVIVDEAHNLKHGFSDTVAARNRVLALALGRPGTETDRQLFPGYGPRATRVLFLSATPVEDSYRQLWNQLDVFGRGRQYEGLRKVGADEEEGREIARQFLLRRVTAITVGGLEHTKNLYRREWRRGGVKVHDEPIRVEDPRQRFVVALVQKRVSELLGHERFNTSFQIGMLASFESFLETARLKRSGDEAGNFDDAEQTDDFLEREGIDVVDVNRLSRSYRAAFGAEMPHPKMDALVHALASAWRSGRKSLVFVRRVASVKELKRKLDHEYDSWLMTRLERELPAEVQSRLARLFEQYRTERDQARERSDGIVEATAGRLEGDEADHGGTDTFFAWFFRGEGPRGVISGANVQQRFVQRGSAYATFFEDNYVAGLLGCDTGEVTRNLMRALQLDEGSLRAQLRARSKRFLPRVKKLARADRFWAVQAAAVEMLKDGVSSWQEPARVVWHQRFEGSLMPLHALEAPEVDDWLETPTFFSRLRARDALRQRLWPKPSCADPVQAFREQELRRQLLASAARLGHAFIDLYVMTIQRLKSLNLRSIEQNEGDAASGSMDRIDEYLDVLQLQMNTPREAREWRAFDELTAIGENFELLLDVNDPDAQHRPLDETARVFGQLLRQQQPVGGMSGQLNQTLVRQFRMPGYPLLLITTDLLQEGEDLHTFCSDVHHYGIAWTPSSMEQRIGRIDRVRSQTERRLAEARTSAIRGDEMLQVYLPHLEDTIEVLQVERVLSRMNEFLRLMHEGLIVRTVNERSINAAKVIAGGRRYIEPIRERLTSAFPVRAEHTQGDNRPLAVSAAHTDALRVRFAQLAAQSLAGLRIEWERQAEPNVLHGKVCVGSSFQPLEVSLRSLGASPSVRCISVIGRIQSGVQQDRIIGSAARNDVRIGAIRLAENHAYDLTVEDEVLLAEDDRYDAARVAALVRRVATVAHALAQEHLSNPNEESGVSRVVVDQVWSRER